MSRVLSLIHIYIALMNKAADAGYRVIILLTGTIEKLRKQTQQRVDEGFTGLDSKAPVSYTHLDVYKRQS